MNVWILKYLKLRVEKRNTEVHKRAFSKENIRVKNWEL
jgi:hypothetical protein